MKEAPGASHAFDGNPANTRLFRLGNAENFMDCLVQVEPDGQQTFGGEGHAATTGASEEMQRSCVKKGASIEVTRGSGMWRRAT